MAYGIKDIATRKLLEEFNTAHQRYVDMRVVWLEHGDSNEVILDVGGCWDRRREEWHSDGETARIIRMQPAQYEAAYWWAGWYLAYCAGGKRPPKYDRKWTMFNVGGRRGGKTDFMEKALFTFAAGQPGSIVWGVSPTIPELEEQINVFENLIPTDWGVFSETKQRWLLAHGGRFELKSSWNPASLKRGRVDVVGMNEAQNHSKKAYTFLRAPIADRGGLLMTAANPPDKPIGRWVLEAYDEAKAGKRNGVLFEFDPKKNPYIDHQALVDMEQEVGEKDYKRDVMGEFLEIGDLVWYSWSPRHNVIETPQVGNVTKEFLTKHLGQPFERAIGIDLQLNPHMSAAVAEFYKDPTAENINESFMWVTDEVVIEGNEHALIDCLEDKGYSPDSSALVIDASAWWQDAERTKGRGSVDIFRSRGWRWCFRPDSKAKRNPQINERVQATNGKMCSHNGRRALFSDPGNYHVNRALRSWENRNGVPYRRSEFAHVSDSVSYLIWRFWPRKLRTRAGESSIGYEKVRRKRSKRERDLDNL